ncbi:MAG: RNA 3'-phosphate cyclase [Nitrosopumilus sp.]|nr:RNA 3'-phosphate cyclase [Nitrosopumilus sp.]
MDFLKINGAYGEGGGQIIRSAITISCVTKQPIHIENIRINRKVPGLRPQHLTAIKILKKISNAQVIGAEIGSTEIKFIPKKIESLELNEDVGTAGSISLILQSIIPVVAISKNKINLIIKGGTNVLWSPTIDYTLNVLREAYFRMGIEFSLKVIKQGYYPKGGGQVNLQVYPANLKPILLTKRNSKKVKIVCTFSKIPIEKIKNEIKIIKNKLINEKFDVDIDIHNQEAIDSGASLLIFGIDENSIIGVDCLFDKKLQKFDIDFDGFLQNSLSVDENLADMLVVPASLTNKKSIFQVRSISKHLETNLFVTSKITGCKYGIGKIPDGFEVIIEGVSDSSIK